MSALIIHTMGKKKLHTVARSTVNMIVVTMTGIFQRLALWLTAMCGPTGLSGLMGLSVMLLAAYIGLPRGYTCTMDIIGVMTISELMGLPVIGQVIDSLMKQAPIYVSIFARLQLYM